MWPSGSLWAVIIAKIEGGKQAKKQLFSVLAARLVLLIFQQVVSLELLTPIFWANFFSLVRAQTRAKLVAARESRGCRRNAGRRGETAALQVGERETLEGDAAAPQFGVLGEECVSPGGQGAKIDAAGVALDFVEVECVPFLVLAYEVDFVFALAVPPAAHPRVAALGLELPAEIPLQRIARECVEVARCDVEESVESPQLDEVPILEDEAEPEAEEAVVDLPVPVLGGRFVEEGLLAGDNPVLVLKLPEEAADVPAAEGLELGRRGLPGGDAGENREVGPVVGAELVREDRPAAEKVLREYSEEIVAKKYIGLYQSGI